MAATADMTNFTFKMDKKTREEQLIMRFSGAYNVFCDPCTCETGNQKSGNEFFAS